MRLTQKINAERRESQAKTRYRRAAAAHRSALANLEYAEKALQDRQNEVARTRELHREAEAELLKAVARVPA